MQIASVLKEWMESTFRNKEIPEGREVYIRSYLGCMYQEIQEKYKLDEPVESQHTQLDTISLLVGCFCLLLSE